MRKCFRWIFFFQFHSQVNSFPKSNLF
jgi:hypothetical protein